MSGVGGAIISDLGSSTPQPRLVGATIRLAKPTKSVYPYLREIQRRLGGAHLVRYLMAPLPQRVSRSAARGVALKCATELSRSIRADVVVAFEGLFVRCLNEGPGYLSYRFIEQLGLPGLIQSMPKRRERMAEWETVLAFGGTTGEAKSFRAVLHGSIASAPARSRTQEVGAIFTRAGQSFPLSMEGRSEQVRSPTARACSLLLDWVRTDAAR